MKRVQRPLERAEEAGQAQVLPAPLDVVLAPRQVVQPELISVSRGRAGIVAEDNTPGGPDLVVEVISGRSRGRNAVLKRHVDERYGVRVYRLIDPDAENVRVFERKDGAYDVPGLLRGAQGLTRVLSPDASTPVAQLSTR